jgi:Lrp/AsnC family leucine-responsive transcriptional regulator
MAQRVRQNRLFTYSPANETLDEVNIQLLRELQRDPRTTMAELGRRVGMSSPAVTERVRRMEENGIITGYALVINPVPLGLPIAAYIRIRPHAGQLPQIAELARSIPEVVECHRITGEDCYLIKAHVRSMTHLEELLDELAPFGQTTTSIVQSSPVPLRGVSLGA